MDAEKVVSKNVPDGTFMKAMGCFLLVFSISKVTFGVSAYHSLFPVAKYGTERFVMLKIRVWYGTFSLLQFVLRIFCELISVPYLTVLPSFCSKIVYSSSFR